MKRDREAGQALLLVILGLSIFLIGAAGLAVDGSHLYAQRQMAQAAADAAAEAGILSIFDGSNTVTTNTYKFTPSGTAANCSSTPNATPCYYAQTLNGFSASTDTVTYDIPSITVPGLSADPVNLLRVTVARNVSTTLMALLGPTATTISASGIAAIVSVASPVPIIVTHPTLPGALSFNGNPSITITGGPRRSIQVNSSDSSSIATTSCSNATVDLSGAGPSDTGADFGDFGGHSTPCFTFTPGIGRYVQPASPIDDPLAGVPVPPIPTTAPAPTSIGSGVSGCPVGASNCQLYSPGLYSGGIDAKNHTLVFKPGIYYVTSGGFGASANGDMVMATGFTDGTGPAATTTCTTSPCPNTNTGWTGNILVYNTGNGSGDVFSVGSNGIANLVGSPASSIYKNILFFEDRTSAAHVGPPSKNAQNFGGGGAMTLIGTIYVTNTLALMTANASQYQQVNLSGNSGSATNITGEIIAGVLNMGGGGAINMSLNASATTVVRQVALVQ